jgi:hypothetical protein
VPGKNILWGFVKPASPQQGNAEVIGFCGIFAMELMVFVQQWMIGW